MTDQANHDGAAQHTEAHAETIGAGTTTYVAGATLVNPVPAKETTETVAAGTPTAEAAKATVTEVKHTATVAAHVESVTAPSAPDAHVVDVPAVKTAALSPAKTAKNTTGAAAAVAAQVLRDKAVAAHIHRGK